MSVERPLHRIRLHEPKADGAGVEFRWDIAPASELYLHHGFRLEFGDELDISRIPHSLWPRLALLCLHPHWALLRPCRVELPFYLGPAEREFWLRMIDTAALQIDAYSGRRETSRQVELLDDGPALPPQPVSVAGARCAAAFSGGKDSLVQSGLLSGLTERPLLVTTTSPVAWAHDHVGEARRRTLNEIKLRLPVELVEVRSDFRASVQNDFSGSLGCALMVNELTDVLLYQATTVAAAAASGISRALMASEADLQYNAALDGAVIQHGHFASSAVTHAALDRLLARWGLGLTSLTYPLHMPQVEALLWRRYPEVADLQFSCWLAEDGRQWCSACPQCLEVAVVILGEGISPARAGLDPLQLLSRWARPRSPDPRQDEFPILHPTRSPRDKLARIVQAMPVERVEEILSADPAVPKGESLQDALEAYRRLRQRNLDPPAPPEPGYLAGFLDFTPQDLRAPLQAILDRYFVPDEDEEAARTATRARSLARWISYPLR